LLATSICDATRPRSTTARREVPAVAVSALASQLHAIAIGHDDLFDLL